MLAPPLCDLDDISVYVPSTSKPWDKQRVQHLYRRMGFGADHATIQSALGMDPAILVDSLVDEAVSLPTTPAPVWGYWAFGDYTNSEVEGPQQILDWYVQFVEDMLNNGLRDKLTLFWSNHFVTQLDVYQCPSYMFQYYNLLQTHGTGNFRNFVHDIGINPAMIVFLNSYQNTATSPNENYARELYELFTLGVDNGYTQTDIVETAKALTGWNGFTDFCAPLTFVDGNHSHANKTIFGQTGDWGYDDVITILFEQRGDQVAQHICKKLYAYFVSPVLDQTFIDGLATTLVNSNFELVPVLKQMFKSEHFFDEDIIGVKIKSPMEMMLTFVKDGAFTTNQEVLSGSQYYGAILGQKIFDPVDVAGWQGDHDWINTSTITGRWLITDYLIGWIYQNHPEELQALALAVVGGNTTDPYLATQMIIDHFTPRGLVTAAEYQQATQVFKWEVPQNYFDANLWDLNWTTVPAQMAVLLQHLSHMPEFQLT